MVEAIQRPFAIYFNKSLYTAGIASRGKNSLNAIHKLAISHARTVVRECCKGDDESQWERVKFDPPPPKNPLTDGHQNLRT